MQNQQVSCTKQHGCLCLIFCHTLDVMSKSIERQIQENSTKIQNAILDVKRLLKNRDSR